MKEKKEEIELSKQNLENFIGNFNLHLIEMSCAIKFWAKDEHIITIQKSINMFNRLIVLRDMEDMLNEFKHTKFLICISDNEYQQKKDKIIAEFNKIIYDLKVVIKQNIKEEDLEKFIKEA